MRISYDAEADAAYIRLENRQGSAPRHTTKAELPHGVSGFIALDWEGDRLIGIEILDASIRLSPTVLENADPPPG